MLLLLPNMLDEELPHEPFLPRSVDEAVASMNGLIAESEKAGRRFLKRFAYPAPKTFREIPIRLLSEHTTEAEMKALLEPLLKGETWGIVSDCGLPCLADPGSHLVALARARNIPVKAFAGPSSLLFALMLSGLPAQRFSFHGYLDRDPQRLAAQIRALEQRSKSEKATQLFIEAPYRNQKLLETLVQTLSPTTTLCIASNLTSPSELILTKPISQWKTSPLPHIDKQPTLFLITCC